MRRNDLGEKGVDVYITENGEKTKTKILLISLGMTSNIYRV